MQLKKIFLAAAMICSALTGRALLSEATDINDLALIYTGSQHRPDWNKELFWPYVVHEYADGKKSWMFDSFLMIEFQVWNEQGVVVSFGESNTPGSQKQDWINLLDTQLGTKTGFGCKALDELIGELIPVLGEPGRKHKVLLTMPSAETKSGVTWGELNGKQLNFNRTEDRVAAQKWYTDLILEKWAEADFKNIELDGVYWVKEAFHDYDQVIVKPANDYLHNKGLKAYWIPYFTAWGRFDWDTVGIDAAFLQPNYYFRETTSIDQLQQAIDDAWEHNMCLEMEFEGYNYSWNPTTKIRSKFAPTNIGLYGYSPTSPRFYQRLVDYIDYFEANAVFEFMPIAYYSGFQAIYDFMNSGHPKDHELVDRLALLMNKRHVENEWDSEPRVVDGSNGIEDVETGDCNIAYAVDGGIYISDNAAGDVAVYTVDGRAVYSRANGGERLAYGETFACPAGIYIVRSGGKSLKIAVR